MIGGDGRIYVGRGWDARGEHKYGHNDAIGVAFIGNFKGAEPSQLQIDGFKSLMETGLKEEKLAKTSEVFSDNLTWIGNLGEDLRENEINLIRALNLT